MAKLKTKGTVLEIASGTTYTAIAQVSGFSISGTATETAEVDTLDATVGIPKMSTGRVGGGTVTYDIIFDPALAGHKTLTALVTSAHLNTSTSQHLQQGWRVKFTDTSSTSMTFNSAGAGFDITGDITDALRSTLTLEVDGCPAFPV